MDVDSLKAFVFVASYGSFAEAAKALFVSESTVSRQVKQLETELGMRLFERSRKGALLTEHGERMLEDAEKVVDAFDAFSQAAERERLQKDALKINYSGATFEADIIAGASAVAAAADDPIPINVFGCNVGKSWRKLQAGKIDLILTYPQCVPDTPGISVEDVYHARSRVAVQRSSPLAQRMRVSLSDLAGETFLVFQRQLAPLGYDFTMHVVQNAIGPCPIKVVPSIDYAVILEKLAVEGGVTIVPDWYENPLPRHIAFIDIVEDDADLTSAFVWRADANKPEIERFVEYARQYARKNHENGRQKHTG